MTNDLGGIYVTIDVNTKNLITAQKRLKTFTRETDKNLNKVSSSASRLTKVLASLVTFEAIRRVSILADKYNVLQQRLRTATKQTNDYLQVSKELDRISNLNGTRLATNVSLFQAIARSAPDLGATTKQVLDLTQTLGQLGVIGGSSAEQMKNGLLQLSQGFSAGILRAEEFNSVTENIPEIAFRIAKGMGLTVGQLRKSVLEGKILSKDVFSSLLGQSSQINQEFKMIPLSLERSLAVLKNNFSKFVGQIDGVTGSTAKLSSLFISMSNVLGGDFSSSLSKIGVYFTDIKRRVDGITDAFSSADDSSYRFKDGLKSIIVSSMKGLYELTKLILKIPQAIEASFDILINVVQKRMLKAIEIVKQGVNEMQTLWLKFKRFSSNLSGSPREDYGKQQANINKTIAGITEQIKKRERLGKAITETGRLGQDELSSKIESYTNAFTKTMSDLDAKFNSDIKAIDGKKNTNAEPMFSGQPLNTVVKIPTQTGNAETEKKLEQLRVSLLTETEIENERYQKSLQLLNESEALKTSGLMSAHKMRERLEQKHQDAINSINSKQTSSQASEFTRRLAMASEHSRSLFNVHKAVSLAMALIDAPKAILSAYTYGARIGGAPMGAIMAGVTTASTAVQIGAIAGAQYRGAREAGGAVHPRGLYQVGEKGSEILNQGGKNYLLSGDGGGRIIPNNKIGGSSKNVIVNVYNVEGHTATTREREAPDGTSIDVFIERVTDTIAGNIMAGDGDVPSAIEGTYGLQRNV